MATTCMQVKATNAYIDSVNTTHKFALATIEMCDGVYIYGYRIIRTPEDAYGVMCAIKADVQKRLDKQA